MRVWGLERGKGTLGGALSHWVMLWPLTKVWVD